MPKDAPIIHLAPRGAKFRVGYDIAQVGMSSRNVVIQMKLPGERLFGTVRVHGIRDFGLDDTGNTDSHYAHSLVSSLNSFAQAPDNVRVWHIEKAQGNADHNKTPAAAADFKNRMQAMKDVLTEAEAGLEFAAAKIGQHGPIGDFMPSHLCALKAVRDALGNEDQSYLVPSNVRTPPTDSDLLEFMMQRKIFVGWDRDGEAYTIYSRGDDGIDQHITPAGVNPHDGNWKAAVIKIMQDECDAITRPPVPQKGRPALVLKEVSVREIAEAPEEQTESTYQPVLKRIKVGKLKRKLSAEFDSHRPHARPDGSLVDPESAARCSWDAAVHLAVEATLKKLRRHMHFAANYDHLRTADPDAGAFIAISRTSGWGNDWHEPLYHGDADTQVDSDRRNATPAKRIK